MDQQALVAGWVLTAVSAAAVGIAALLGEWLFLAVFAIGLWNGFRTMREATRRTR